MSPRVTRIARPPRPARPKKNPSQWAFSLNRHPAPLDPPARADRPLPSPSSVRPQGDLKKEIKKLQRFRDQVKQWAGSNDVRDKTPLLEARKLIEGKMESFKIIEKETKTKAFSKQGLEAARERKDPKEAARDEAREWLNASVDELQTQIEAFEAEIETIAEPKKSKSKTRPPRLGHLEESMSRHLQHIQRMELVLRLVDNEALAPEDVTDLKDLVDDYVERNQDDFDEFGDVEDMYADLELDDLAEAVASGEVSHDVGKPSALQKLDGAGDDAHADDGNAGAGASGAAGKGGLSKGGSEHSSSGSLLATGTKGKPGELLGAKPMSPAGGPALGSGGKKIPAPLGLNKAPNLASGAEPPAPLGLQSGGPVPGPKGREGTLGGNGGSWGAPGGGNGTFPTLAGGDSKAGNPPQQQQQPAPGAGAGLQQQQSWGFGSANADPPVFGVNSSPQQAPPSSSGSGVKFPLPKPTPGSPLLGGQGGNAGGPGGANANAAAGSPAKNLPAPKFGVDPSASKSGGTGTGTGSASNGEPKPADGSDSLSFDLPGGLADLADGGGFGGTDKGSSSVAPIAVALGGMTHEDPSVNVRLLESAYKNLPTVADGAWTRRRREPPSSPAPTSYPTASPPVLDNPALFERLDADALFFAFYHQQGTAQQYLAARELKRANWRFHKKYATWFARQEDPKVSTEEYEQGNYIYFDFNMGQDGGWCQRSKGDFLFEYSQLESEMN